MQLHFASSLNGFVVLARSITLMARFISSVPRHPVAMSESCREASSKVLKASLKVSQSSLMKGFAQSWWYRPSGSSGAKAPLMQSHP
jgi:hypothetical protein